MSTDIRFVTVADRPDLLDAVADMDIGWPLYIQSEPILTHWVVVYHPQHQLFAIDDNDNVVARAVTVPFCWDGDPDSLPDTGWDQSLRYSIEHTYDEQPLNTLCALEIAVAIDRRNQHLSTTTLEALTEHARKHGFTNIVVPLRPSHKHTRPHQSLAEYLAETRPDGEPNDPWLRVHTRAGGQILKICSASVTIAGSLAQWRSWTGLPLTADGPTVIPQALTPLHVDLTHDYAVYIEPNVWVQHRLDQTS